MRGTSLYFCEDIIKNSLEYLRDIHPFFLITYLSYKEANLPIIDPSEIKLKDTRNLERQFLEKYFRPTKKYDGFFRPSRVSDRSKMWVPKKYPDAGLQSIRTRNTIITRALIHDHRGGYGWDKDYVNKLLPLIKNNLRLPIFYIAVWLYREREWNKSSTKEDIIIEFKKQFNITNEEERILFDDSIPDINEEDLFCENPLDWDQLKKIIGNYPRAPLEEGGLLKSLSLTGIGPIDNFDFKPGERLNIIAGDNGLGKTFLLDCSWWALSGNWAGKAVNPRSNVRWSIARIQYEIGSYNEGETIKADYNWEKLSWINDSYRKILPGLLIYARIDNSFAIWDPAKFTLYESIRRSGEQLLISNNAAFVNPVDFQSGHLVLTEQEVRDGKQISSSIGITYESNRVVCNGLVRDWVAWSNEKDRKAFDIFTSLLKKLSPPGFKPIIPGKPVRIITDTRPIPTIKLPYGDVLITDVSAGIGRMIELAYLITWVWTEHITISRQIKKNPQNKMIILIDEMESHLHPRWQRTIIPALMNVAKILSKDLEIQFIISTHSPLVLASSEPYFNPDMDKLFYLDLHEETIELKDISFIRYGKIDNWLQSELFGLKDARSVNGEKAIQKANEIQLEENPDPEKIKTIHNELQKYLPEIDDFWPRWLYFARKHGVEI
jgi:hypothetical protein